MSTLAILTNVRADDARSMIGYGEVLFEAERHSEYGWVAVRPMQRFEPT